MRGKFFNKKEVAKQAAATPDDIHDLLASISSYDSSNINNDINTDEVLLSADQINNGRPVKRRRATDKQAVETLDGFVAKKGSSLAGSSFICTGPAAPSSIHERPFHHETPAAAPDDPLSIRKIGVMNTSVRSVEIKYSRSTAALYLPRNYRMLSDLFRILESICVFNRRRGLVVLLNKHQSSIENLFKHRVDSAILGQLNFICSGSVSFTPVKVLDEGVRKETFRIDVQEGFDIDMALFNHYSEEYGRWLSSNGIEGRVCRFHPDFLQAEHSIPQRPLGPEEKEPEPEVRQVAKAKAATILERVRERERLRKEEFIKECKVADECGAKLESIFLISARQAIKLDELVFKIGGFGGRSRILNVLGDGYYLKEINGEEYVVKR